MDALDSIGSVWVGGGDWEIVLGMEERILPLTGLAFEDYKCNCFMLSVYWVGVAFIRTMCIN